MEESFLLQMHLGMSYTELQNMPVRYRHWYVKRLSKHFDQKNRTSTDSQDDSQRESLSKMQEFINKKID